MAGVRWVVPFEIQPPQGGACVGYPTAWWFPERHASGEAIKDMYAAKEICFGCHIRAECLDYAIGAMEQFGIWGGLSIKEREQVIKRRREDGTLVLFQRIPISDE